MSYPSNNFNIDEDIREKRLEFERYLESVYATILNEKTAFDLAMKEYKRSYVEIEQAHLRELEDLQGVRGHLRDAYKCNARNVRFCQRGMMTMANLQLTELQNRKETVRAKVKYNQSIFTSLTNFFEVKYVTLTDYAKKVTPIRKIGRGQEGMVCGCDSSDNKIYMADCINNQVCVFNKQSGQPLEPIGVGKISQPWGVKANKGIVYVTEPENGRVSVFNKKGELQQSRMLDNRRTDPRLATAKPAGIDVDKQGRMFIADTGQKKVHIFESFYPKGEIRESLKSPQDVKVVGSNIYVLDCDEILVKVFDRGGNLLKSLIPNVGNISPQFFTVDRNGNILICNQNTRCIHIYDPQGNPIHQIPCGPSVPFLGGISVNKNGEVTLACLGEDMCYIF
ncbi:PEP-CTERM domain protein [Oopsacas minuta]|uniref:PEP-CTERM domain protein n=1 Tax=Oopsacas minuta TaxID=111878 RepID=A0AAV7K546_9METZ|nr:PEP-CTERM domain protein [Oopsacas minuta]